MKRNNMETITVSPLMHQDEGSFIWVDEFDGGALRHFCVKFMQLEQDPLVDVIPVYISSYGGDVNSMLAMRDIIKSSPKPVATIAIGKAMSAAACLLAAGTPGMRFAGNDTMFMIHSVSSGVGGKAAEMSEATKSTKHINNLLFGNLSKDTGIDAKDFLNHIRGLDNADWYFSVDVAKRINIIDEVCIPRCMTQPSKILLATQPKYKGHALVKESVRSAPKKRSKK